MRVRKGQSSIRTAGKGVNLVHGVVWRARGDWVSYHLRLVNKYYLPKDRKIGIPAYACVFDKSICFYPAAKCSGEIRVDYSTRHVL